MKARYAALALTAALPFAAAAEAPRYTYVEGGYQYLDIDGGGIDADGDGLGIGGSLALSDRVYVLASYADIDLDFGVDASEFSAGVGGSWPTSENVHLVGAVGYTSAEIDTPVGDFDDSGLLLSGGVRWMVNERVELTGELTYVDLDDAGDDTTLSIGGLYELTPDLALEAGVSFGDDVTGYSVGVRYYFPGLR